MASPLAPYTDPLTKSQVLEQEYQALHGRLPDGYIRYRNEKLEGACGGGAVSVYDLRRRFDADLRRHLYHYIHQRAIKPGAGPPRTALCLSGGGIRSATFGLGVLQGLAKYGLLQHFDYLSTVSGGGYVGS